MTLLEKKESKMEKHYVEFLYTGLFFLNSEIKEIPNRETKFNVPEQCFGYRFFERQVIKDKNGKEVLGEPKNCSGTYYFGEIKSLEEIKKENSIEKNLNLIINMESWGFDNVVKTRKGNYRPFLKGDTIISEQ